MAKKYCVILKKENPKSKMCHIVSKTELKRMEGRFPPKVVYELKKIK